MQKSQKVTRRLKKYYDLDQAYPMTKEEKVLHNHMLIVEGKFSPMQSFDEIKKKFKSAKNIIVANRWTNEYYGDVVVFQCSEKKALKLIDDATTSLKQSLKGRG